MTDCLAKMLNGQKQMTESNFEKPLRRPRYRGAHPRQFDQKYKERNPGKYAAEVEKVVASGKTPAGTHRPIMVREVMEFLAPQPGSMRSIVR